MRKRLGQLVGTRFIRSRRSSALKPHSAGGVLSGVYVGLYYVEKLSYLGDALVSSTGSTARAVLLVSHAKMSRSLHACVPARGGDLGWAAGDCDEDHHTGRNLPAR